MQRTGAEGLNEEIIGPPHGFRSVFGVHVSQQGLDPGREADVFACLPNVRLCDIDSNLYATLPAALLHIEDATEVIRPILNGFRSEEKRDAVLCEISWCWMCHGAWCRLYHCDGRRTQTDRQSGIDVKMPL